MSVEKILRSISSYVTALGFELATLGSAIRRATDCAMEPGSLHNETDLNICCSYFREGRFSLTNVP